VPSSLRVHREAGLARFELWNDDATPRLDASLLRELDAACKRCLDDPACLGIVLHGSDSCFAAGADISELAALNGVRALEYSRRTQLLFDGLAQASKPVVAAIRGYCVGGGFDLALACHWRLAAPDAMFRHPGAALGLLAGWGGTQRLPRLVGRARALELLLRAEPIGAAAAARMGIVDAIVLAEELLVRAAEVVRDAVRSTQC
jgi:enoyl-CoA hydratase/carnithine racemase